MCPTLPLPKKSKWSLNITSQPSICETAKKGQEKTTNREEFLKNLNFTTVN